MDGEDDRVFAASAACSAMRSQWHCSMQPAAELVRGTCICVQIADLLQVA
jgi:hypothetical protein